MEKKFTIGIGIFIGLAVFAAVLILLPRSATETSTDTDILSRNGLHWHSMLKISIDGEAIAIPADIGLGAVHKPVHTHDPDGTVHMEFGGLVRERDVMLGEFFKSWNKDMRSFGSNMRMMVNGTERTEYESYLMRDGDIIELYYES